MSFMKCANCEHLVDTDAHPESFREEFEGKYGPECLCEHCYEQRLLYTGLVGDLR